MQVIIIYNAQKMNLMNYKLIYVQYVICETKPTNCDHFDIKNMTIRLSSVTGRNRSIS